MIFYAPKNFKNGRFIANRYRVIDLVIMISGCTACIFLMLLSLTAGAVNYPLLIISVFAFLFIFVLVQQFHIYHNFLVFFIYLYSYIRRRKTYIWGGIVKYEEKED